jgi:hypothetical protein
LRIQGVDDSDILYVVFDHRLGQIVEVPILVDSRDVGESVEDCDRFFELRGAAGGIPVLLRGDRREVVLAGLLEHRGHGGVGGTVGGIGDRGNGRVSRRFHGAGRRNVLRALIGGCGRCRSEGAALGSPLTGGAPHENKKREQHHIPEPNHRNPLLFFSCTESGNKSWTTNEPRERNTPFGVTPYSAMRKYDLFTYCITEKLERS